MLNIDSWVWKVAVIGAILAMREFVRMMTASESQTPLASDNSEQGEPANLQANYATGAQGFVEILDSAAIAFGLVFFVIQPFLLQAFYIPSGSMEDTLQFRPSGDRLLVSKWVYRLRDPRRDDVVVFVPPKTSRARPGDEYIKRCIGVPGDVVYAQNRRFFRKARGEQQFVELREPYVKWSANGNLYSYDMKVVDGKVYSREYPSFGSFAQWQEQGKVGQNYPSAEEQDRIQAAEAEPIPADKFLMLGDHRNDSSDSHAWGLVPRENIVGKAMCVFWPPSRVGTLDQLSTHPRKPAGSAPVLLAQ